MSPQELSGKPSLEQGGLKGMSPQDPAESRIRVLELGLAEAIEWCETLVGESLGLHDGEAIDRLTALLDEK